MEKFFQKFVQENPLPAWADAIILIIAGLILIYALGIIVEKVLNVLLPKGSSRRKKAQRTNARIENDQFVFDLHGQTWKFSLYFLTNRSGIKQDDLETLTVMATNIIEGLLLFETKCKGHIGENGYNYELYKEIDVQDPTSTDIHSTLDDALGHHHGKRVDGHVISIQVQTLLGDPKYARHVVAHEILHEYIFGATKGVRYLGEGITEYIARNVVGLPIGGHGSYQGLVDVVSVLVDNVLRHCEFSLMVFAFQQNGLKMEINKRLKTRLKNSELIALFSKLPMTNHYTVDELASEASNEYIAQTLNLLLWEIHDLENHFADKDEQLNNYHTAQEVIKIAIEFVNSLEYKNEFQHTIVAARVPVPDGSTNPKNKVPVKKGIFWTSALELLTYSWRAFRSLSGKGKAILAAFLITVLLFFGIGGYYAFRFMFISKTEKISAKSYRIVMNKENLSAEEFEQKKRELKRYVAEPQLFGSEEAASLPDRFKQYYPGIEEAAKKRGINPNVIAALGFQESYLKLNKFNKDTKASGMYQFLPSTSKLSGLVVDGIDYRLMSDDNKRDDRQDFTKSTLATAELYRQAFQRWGGDEDMAAWDHHAGTNYPGQAMRSYLDEVYSGWEKTYGSMAKAMKALKVGYWDLRLRPTPTFAPKTWKLMTELLGPAHDFSADYPMRVELAQEYIEELASGNTKRFYETVAKYKPTLNKLHLGGEATNEERISVVWWHWYANLDPKKFVKDCDAMEKMHSGLSPSWVKVPSDSKKTGFLVDQSMGSIVVDKLSEKDKAEFLASDEANHNTEHKNNHQYALPETIGMDMWLVDLYKEIYSSEGRDYEPVTITSLGRSLWFQKMLPKMGFGAATDQLPLHADGLATDFSIGEQRLSYDAKLRWMYTLYETRAIGAISYSFEGNAANTHIVPSPEWRDRFRQYYFDRQAITFKEN